MSLSIADRLDLHELASRYGNVLDDGAWDRLAEVFTADARYELTGMGRLDVLLNGLHAIVAHMRDSADHPLAHHVTNIETWQEPGDGPDTARMRSLIVAALPEYRAGSATYLDRVERTADGWRIADRTIRSRARR